MLSRLSYPSSPISGPEMGYTSIQKKDAAILFWLVYEYDAGSFVVGVEVFCQLTVLVPADYLKKVIDVSSPDLGSCVWQSCVHGLFPQVLHIHI